MREKRKVKEQERRGWQCEFADCLLVSGYIHLYYAYRVGQMTKTSFFFKVIIVHAQVNLSSAWIQNKMHDIKHKMQSQHSLHIG